MNFMREELFKIQVEKFIEIIRSYQKDFLAGKSDVSGHDMLREALEDGIINVSTYIQMKQAVDFPNAEVNISITT